jgi:hypothetical protein
MLSAIDVAEKLANYSTLNRIKIENKVKTRKADVDWHDTLIIKVKADNRF